MKEAKLIIDGKEYAVQMKDEDVKTLTRPETGYEFTSEDKLCYATATDGAAMSLNHLCSPIFELYDTGNYYTDKELAEDIARADRLYRRLRQWQALNDTPVEWDNDDWNKFYIYYNFERKRICYETNHAYETFGTIYFSSQNAVEAAIAKFRDELTWYFTEFKQRLDERTMK